MNKKLGIGPVIVKKISYHQFFNVVRLGLKIKAIGSEFKAEHVHASH